MFVLFSEKVTLENDDLKSLLAYVVLPLHTLSLFHIACFFVTVLSSLLFDILISFHILDILTAFGLVWMWTQFGLCGSIWIWTLYLHMLFVLNYAALFDPFWICAFYNFVHFMFSKQYSSLFVNREKSRDLQRGLTDSSQLPLMMSPN